MLFRLIYDDALAQAAYLIGCQATGEAIVIDPERDVDRYTDLAKREGLRIVAAADTHVHADFLSGVRELCERVDAEAWLSAEGGDEWRYRWPDLPRAAGGSYRTRLLRHDDTIMLGKIRFRVVHTPGHTPEHICFEVTDTAADPDDPIGILSGDFVFVGDLGRPDLLETAAGYQGDMEPSARRLCASARAFARLPEFMQVWPGHGAGSACGKALGAVPQTTVGYELRTNAPLRVASDEDAFVREILSGQPEPPAYFARMKRQNLEGPPVLAGLPNCPRLAPADLPKDAAVLDTRPWKAFRAGALTGALFAPVDRAFPTIAGSYLDADRPVVLVASASDVEPAVRSLVRIGIDRIAGVVDPIDLPEGLPETPEVDVAEADRRRRAGDARLLDVRKASEFAEGHAPGAHNIAHVRLAPRLDEAPKDAPLLVSCRSGARSARATAYLRSRGYDAINVRGGFLAWESAGLEVQR